MEKIDMVLWIISGGFTITFGLMLVMWNSIGKLDEKFAHLEHRMDQIETRLTIIETILAMIGAPIKAFKHPSKDP